MVEVLEDRRVLSVSIQLQPSSDSGVSDSDRLTNVVEPTFDVTVSGAGTVGIDVDGDGAIDVSQTVTESGTYALTSPTLADGERAVVAVFTPDAGDSEQATVDVTVDTRGPQIGKGRPIERADATSRTVSFTEDIDPASVSAASFTLLEPDGVTMGGISAASVTGATVTLTTDPLIASGDYLLTALTTIVDFAGNLMN